jgi:REP element-mobilizing transposase RayT
MNRGGARRDSFINDEQRYLFLDLLAVISEKYAVEIHSYCLMSNHFHLLIKTPQANISAALQYLMSNYTLRFNKMCGVDGPLFRGRFKSLIIDEEAYLLEVSRYIHLNPVKARLVMRPSDYFWSSYASFVGQTPKPQWLRTCELLRRFGNANNPHYYRQFVEQPNQSKMDAFYSHRSLPSILGSKAFRRHIFFRASTSAQKKEKVAPDLKVKQVIGATARYFNLTEDEVTRGRRGSKNLPRQIGIFLANRRLGSKLSILEKEFGVGRSTLSEITARVKNVLVSDPHIAQTIEVIWSTIQTRPS